MASLQARERGPLARLAGGLRLWATCAGASLRAQLSYRLSFALGLLGSFVVTGIDFIGLWALFDRFERLAGWSLAEVCVFYAASHLAFALAEMIGGGFDRAGDWIRRGELDRLLLRPRSTVLQLLAHEFSLRRLGRASQAALVLCWAVPRLDVAWDLPRIGLLCATIGAGTCLFLGLFALQATLSIWTVETLEVMNATTYGGATAAHYPLSIYARWFRGFFTYVVPLACVAYYPLLIVLGRDDPHGAATWLGWVTPLAGPAFLALALAGWNRGVRAYTSTGS